VYTQLQLLGESSLDVLQAEVPALPIGCASHRFKEGITVKLRNESLLT
jgi:hypothetical protein